MWWLGTWYVVSCAAQRQVAGFVVLTNRQNEKINLNVMFELPKTSTRLIERDQHCGEIQYYLTLSVIVARPSSFPRFPRAVLNRRSVDVRRDVPLPCSRSAWRPAGLTEIQERPSYCRQRLGDVMLHSERRLFIKCLESLLAVSRGIWVKLRSALNG